MTKDELYLARNLFKVKVFQCDGQAFQDLFCSVMELRNKNFKRVKPQGRTGDRKNDGFDETTGSYYQAYAPEDLKKSDKRAGAKLVEDFKGLYDFWNSITPIKSFGYVMNDKYKGTLPGVELLLKDIEKKYPTVKCSSFLSKNLEDVFLELDEYAMLSVVGYVPSPERIANIEYDVVNEVVAHLTNVTFYYGPESVPKDPDFEKKVKFNKLSAATSALLRQGSYQRRQLEEYFRLNSKFVKDDLRGIFESIYSSAVQNISDEAGKSDMVFLYLVERASPRNSKPIQDAVIVLISYFFEKCDVFEIPK